MRQLLERASASGFFLPEGASYLPAYLSPGRQLELASVCVALARGPQGFYRPDQWSGTAFQHDTICLGKNWNPRARKYDARQVPPIPDSFVKLARDIAHCVGMKIAADIAILTRYRPGDKLALHRDQDESAESIAQGIPVISLSLGDDAEFKFVASDTADIRLRSGDAFIFGGAARMCLHGIERVFAGTGPLALKRLGLKGRLNITFRQY